MSGRNILKAKIISITKDFGLNLLASMISTIISQLVLYPFLASFMSADRYGMMLTVMGVANTVAVSCGGSLNNTRLLLQNKISSQKESGDFSIILLGSACASAIILLLVYKAAFGQSYIESILVVTFAILCLLRSYVSVEYRIILNYKKNLISNSFVAIGNLLGVLILVVISNEKMWPLSFVIGEICGFIYVSRTTKLLREPLKRSALFNSIIKKEAVLLLTSLSSNLLTYLDRLLLLPLLGGMAVSCYTVASVFGKCLGILITPLAGVLLSYYSQKGFEMSRSLFWKINFSTIICGVAFCLVSIGISPWFTSTMYPSLFSEASKYLLIANVTAIINAVANMIQPSVLKFAPTGWQLFIQGMYCLIYLLGGIFATREFELWGFAFVAMIAAVVKTLILFFVGHFYINREA